MSNPLSRRCLTAYTLFAALTIPCGIVVHLVAELAALGYQQDAFLIFSSKHAYLAAFAALSFSSLLGISAWIPESERRRVGAQIIADLPFGGRGTAFSLCSFFAQFGFFVLTQASEGDPIGQGDLGIAFLAACIASCAGALLLSRYNIRLLRAIGEIVALLVLGCSGNERLSVVSDRFEREAWSFHDPAFTFVCSKRPPPLFLSV